MTFESISGDAENTQTSAGISRRSIIKVGAHAAWAVPLVQVVAAAPAVAVSGTTTRVSWAGFSGSYSSTDARNLDVTASIANDGSTSASGVQVVLTVPVPVNGCTTPAGWTVSRNGQDFTFTKTTPLSGAASATLPVTFNLPSPAGAALSLTGSAGASNAPFVSSAASVAKAPDSTVAMVGTAGGANASQNFTNKVLTVSGAVKDNGPRTVRGVSVTVNLTRAASRSDLPITISGTNWTIAPTTSGAVKYTLTYTGDVLPGDRTSDFTATFTYGSSNSVTATLTPAATSV